ncbi:hypothetical protein HPP92_027206 [Vanilla planifolia]|uniref:Late embryogenesis abundant protein LEA-2 subgroup domain-containing protein n=1 Tax=Vanilla planifolia TaxID=51239 RepID=A0A835PCZ6_VANPL|nr:hypothetical protein HPP92_027206 [Vanilla planifolia]
MTNRDRQPFSGSDLHYIGPPSSYSFSAAAVSLKDCCYCLFLLFIFLVLISLAVALVLLLVIRPKKPVFDLQHVGVEHLLLTPQSSNTHLEVGPAAAYLSLNITLQFRAVNPNTVRIEYGAVEFSVLHRGVPLAEAQAQRFEQPAHSSWMVETRVTLSRFNVLQADAFDLVEDAELNDRVELAVAGDVGAKALFLGLSSPRVQVSLFCAIVISPSKQSLTYKHCGAHGLNV